MLPVVNWALRTPTRFYNWLSETRLTPFFNVDLHLVPQIRGICAKFLMLGWSGRERREVRTAPRAIHPYQ